MRPAGAWLLALILGGGLSGCVGVLLGGAAVGVGAGMAYDRRSSGALVEDTAIEWNAGRALSSELALAGDDVHIRVHSYNRILLLTGEVPGPAERERADAVARDLPNVRQIYNELVIGPPGSLTSRANDLALATKVKASLFNVPGDLVDFNPTRVRVVTEQGTVYLFGLLRPEEAAAVTEQVRWVSGVQKVVTLYEYLEPPPQG